MTAAYICVHESKTRFYCIFDVLLDNPIVAMEIKCTKKYLNLIYQTVADTKEQKRD